MMRLVIVGQRKHLRGRVYELQVVIGQSRFCSRFTPCNGWSGGVYLNARRSRPCCSPRRYSVAIAGGSWLTVGGAPGSSERSTSTMETCPQ